MWFADIEFLIRARALPSSDRDMINRDMADHLCLEYKAGQRMENKLLAVLSPSGAVLPERPLGSDPSRR